MIPSKNGENNSNQFKNIRNSNIPEMKKSLKTQRTAPVGVIQGMTKNEVKVKDELKKDEEDVENLRS